MTLPLATADLWTNGTTFSPSASNVTYYFTENVSCDSIDDTATGNACLNITGGDFAGEHCLTSATAITVQFGAPNSSNVNLTLIELLHGRQVYNISWISKDIDGDSMDCWVETQSGNVTLSYNNGTKTCYGQINITQNATNTFIPASTDNTTTNQSKTLKGVEIAFNEHFPDTSKNSNLSTQFFLKEYNITSNITDPYTDMQWSHSASDTTKTINISNGLSQDNQTTHSGDYITEDDWVIGGTTFNISQGYSIYRTFLVNNTLSATLPEYQIGIKLEQYDNNSLAEIQNGILWPDLSSTFNSTHLLFNISLLNASGEQYYKYSYDANLITWTGDISADYRLFGDYKAWTLDRVYSVNFNLSGKTLQQTVQQSELGEWVGKTSTWTSSLIQNSTSLIYTHTTTDNVVDVDFSFENATIDDYVYQILYYTPVAAGGGGGGGGGGGVSTAIIEDRVERIVAQQTEKKGYIEFAYPGYIAGIPYFGGKNLYHEVVIKAVGGPVNASLEFSDNIDPYFKGGICELDKERCYNGVDMAEGDEKYIFMISNFSNPVFREDLLEVNRIDGYVQVLSGAEPGPNQYNLTMEKFYLFDKSLEVKTDLFNDKVEHKTAYYLTAIVYMLVIIIIFAVILKLMGAW